MLCVLRCPACELIVAVDETETEIAIAACPRCAEGGLERTDGPSPSDDTDGEATAD